MYNFQNNEFRIYNGVNHSLSIFTSPTDFTANRKGQYFLTNHLARPNLVINQNRPLSARTCSTPLTASPIFFFPESIGAQLDTIPNPADYDLIVVSGIYAQLACQVYFNNPDFLDRLYVPVPLFADDPQHSENCRKIGVIGFRKVLFPKTPLHYLSDLRSGHSPSLASIKICIELYRQFTCDPSILVGLQKLEQWLTNSTFSTVSNSLFS